MRQKEVDIDSVGGEGHVNGETRKERPHVLWVRSLELPPPHPSLPPAPGSESSACCGPSSWISSGFQILPVISTTSSPRPEQFENVDWGSYSAFLLLPCSCQGVHGGREEMPAQMGRRVSECSPTFQRLHPHYHLGPQGSPENCSELRGCGTGLAFTSIWFCASLEPQEKERKKENSFQVDREHVTPWGYNRMRIEAGSRGH